MHFSYTLLLVIVTCLISFYAYENRTWFVRLSYRPYDIKRNKAEAYRFITHGFIHADFLHLFFNMFVLYNFGRGLEAYFYKEYGSIGLYYFVLLYFGAILFGTLPAYYKHKDNIMYTSIGASGGTTGLVFSYIALMPFEPLGLAFLPGLPAIVFGILILASEYYLSRRGRTNIAHDAHIYGALYGFVFTLLIDRQIMTDFIAQVKDVFQ